MQWAIDNRGKMKVSWHKVAISCVDRDSRDLKQPERMEAQREGCGLTVLLERLGCETSQAERVTTDSYVC